MGTTRLAVAFVAGFIALAYLAVWVTPLVKGRIEVSATEVSIDRIEAEGFPDAAYLKVTGGYLVFAEGDAEVAGIRDKGEASKAQGELHHLTVPVVSGPQWEEWQQNLQRDEPIYASRLRLAVRFRGEHVARLWPELKERAESGETLDSEPIQMDVVGETEPMRFLLSEPLQSHPQNSSLDVGQMRGLRFEKHHNSLGNLLKGLAIGLGLLTLSIVIIRYHRRHPTAPPRPTLNVEALEDLAGSDADADVDIDVD